MPSPHKRFKFQKLKFQKLTHEKVIKLFYAYNALCLCENDADKKNQLICKFDHTFEKNKYENENMHFT